MKKAVICLCILMVFASLLTLSGCNTSPTVSPENVIDPGSSATAEVQPSVTPDSSAEHTAQPSDSPTPTEEQTERPIGFFKDLTFEHGGMTRQFMLYLPTNLLADVPLVFVLHGYTGSAQNAAGYGMNEVADEHGFAVCYPSGTLDERSNTHWNARFSISDTDDIGFLTALAAFLQTEYALNANKTFSCGFSNGGFMSYTLACETDVFAAVASVGGTMSGETWETRDIANPTPILQIHGTNDNAVPLDGSMSAKGGWGGAPPMEQIIAFWAELNGSSDIQSEFLPSGTTATYHTNGIDGAEVWFMQIDNWGHRWPKATDNKGIVASELIWQFFSKY